jgi:isopenicillin N synthase-like dioxygenase
MEIPLNMITELKEQGFFVLSLSDWESKRIARVFEAGRAFFGLSTDAKDLCRLPDECGYRPKGIEYSETPERPDEIESFTVTLRNASSHAELRPEKARILYEQMRLAIHVLEPIAEALTIQMANAVSHRDFSSLLRGALRRWSRLQLNFSRPLQCDRELIHDAHEDGNLLTLACATVPGLELQTADHKFEPCPLFLPRIIVMPGEITWLLSGGEIQPLWHRVRPPTDCVERLATLFFCDLDPVACEPWVRNHINSDVDIGSRVLTNVSRFGLSGFTSV